MHQVESAAPDSSSVVAGRKLAKPGPWSEVGVQADLLWGSCQGSGKTPYRVSIDTMAPAYRCSCPSRKFPCKHALGLLFLWAEGQIAETGEVADFARSWHEARQNRAAAKAEPKEQTDEQRAAAEARAARREDRVGLGLAELERFIADQLQEGLGAHTSDRPARLKRVAARMIDAQAPGIASRLRELAILPQTPDWPAKVIDEYGSLSLLAKAWRGREKLPDDLAHVVRQRIGFTTRTQDVLATPALRDRWVVLGMTEADEEQVSVRRVWLWGRDTGQRALVLFFSAGGTGFDTNLLPGSQVDADLHFYPGTPRLRAAVGTRHAEQPKATGWAMPGGDIATAATELRNAVVADPWLTTWPVAIHGQVAANDQGFWLVAETGLLLCGSQNDLWRLLAETGSQPVTVFGELSAAGLRPLSFLTEGRVRVL